MMDSRLVAVLGGGEFGSAVTLWLFKAGLPVVMIVRPSEMHLRRNVCMAEAIFSGTQQIGDVTASLIDENILMNFEDSDYARRMRKAVHFHIQTRHVPVIILEELPEFVSILEPQTVVQTDKEPFPGITLDSAPLVMGLHPWHRVQQDCHIAVESRMNFQMGEIIISPPERDERPDLDFHYFRQPWQTVKSPLGGVFLSLKNIGDEIHMNEPIAKIEDIEIRSPFDGQIWGLFHSGKIISAGNPFVLICQEMPSEDYKSFGFIHKLVAGSVLREILQFHK